MDIKPTQDLREAFSLQEEPVYVPGGEGRTYKAGQVILKHINKDSVEYTTWIADLFSSIQEDGFRVSRPLKTQKGEWITSSGWSAWAFLEGHHNFEDHIGESIRAIQSFHKATKRYPKPEFLNSIESPYARADMYTFEQMPLVIHKEVKSDVERLYALRQPIKTENQLIHGDLNPDNILLSDALPPAIIDIAPYWRPAEFGLAIYAYWIAAYRNKPEQLSKFSHVPYFNQMFVRAGIRMLLIMSEFNNVHELDKYKRATEIIEEYIK